MCDRTFSWGAAMTCFRALLGEYDWEAWLNWGEMVGFTSLVSVIFLSSHIHLKRHKTSIWLAQIYWLHPTSVDHVISWICHLCVTMLLPGFVLLEGWDGLSRKSACGYLALVFWSLDGKENKLEMWYPPCGGTNFWRIWWEYCESWVASCVLHSTLPLSVWVQASHSTWMFYFQI